MNPERARQLRDQERGLARAQPAGTAAGAHKRREIRFCKLKQVQQVADALDLLATLPGLAVTAGPLPNGVTVTYEIADYCMEGLETLLIDRGFHLENTLYCKLVRALVYFTEETQRHNLQQPERLIKQSQAVYSHAWDQHPHGDRDETPPELREYK